MLAKPGPMEKGLSLGLAVALEASAHCHQLSQLELEGTVWRSLRKKRRW